MNPDAKKTLKRFQCDYNRSLEETFARFLAENEQVRLFFINENQAFTDGRNIVVDPAFGEVFADQKALVCAEDYMRLGHTISSDAWYALRMITRGQTIHECLHILYSDFPNGILSDQRATTKVRIKVLSLIDNIIEDAFIEAAGCSVYDNVALYLQFLRLAILFAGTPVDGVINRAFNEEITETQAPIPFVTYLHYMATFLLYPMVALPAPPASIAPYVERTKPLFLDGSTCGEPKARYRYTAQVFDIIEPLIPAHAADLDEVLLETMRPLERILPGRKTHGAEDKTISTYQSKGQSVTVSRRLFTDAAGNRLPKEDFGVQIVTITNDYRHEKKAALSIINAQPVVVHWTATQFDCANVHKEIKIIETKPKPNLYLKRAYQNIYNKYQINIHSYNNRFTRLLTARVPLREEKQLYGSGINSTRLADVRKRYWYRNTADYGIPDIAVLLLIDGSGSMSGPRKESAMVSSVILHEVLKKQGIPHGIVEHRAECFDPVVRVNILVGFNAKNEEKYNLMTLAADGNSREGLALFWAEQFLNTYTTCTQKLIIVLADGEPAHEYDAYYPPVSSKDTANAAAKIMKRGTDIIAVALDDHKDDHRDDGLDEYDDDDEYACYETLKTIYPSVIACTDLQHLTGQLLGIISKNLR